MTAEVAILNKSAIALAADSAVTIHNYRGEKIFNTANKLFNLSKYHPIGIMVYNNADFMGIPWETIIKAYRVTVGKTEKYFNTIREQSDDFINFVRTNREIIPKPDIDEFKEDQIFQIQNLIKNKITQNINILINEKKQADINIIINEVFKKH
jgi:hypothetical protein